VGASPGRTSFGVVERRLDGIRGIHAVHLTSVPSGRLSYVDVDVNHAHGDRRSDHGNFCNRHAERFSGGPV
jgi:hypothetical protein